MSEREPTVSEDLSEIRRALELAGISRDGWKRVAAHVEALEGALRQASECCARPAGVCFGFWDKSEPPTTCPTCGQNFPERYENDPAGPDAYCTDPWHTVPTGPPESAYMPKPKPTTEQQFIREAGRGHTVPTGTDKEAHREEA